MGRHTSAPQTIRARVALALALGAAALMWLILDGTSGSEPSRPDLNSAATLAAPRHDAAQHKTAATGPSGDDSATDRRDVSPLNGKDTDLTATLVITDSVGTGIGGANIQDLASEDSWTTDEVGVVALYGQDAFNGEYLISAAGYLPSVNRLFRTRERVSLEQDPGVRVLVQDASGAPVPGVELQIVPRPVAPNLQGDNARATAKYSEVLTRAHSDERGLAVVYGALFLHEFQILEASINGAPQRVIDLKLAPVDPINSWLETVVLTLNDRSFRAVVETAQADLLSGLRAEVEWKGVTYTYTTDDKGVLTVPCIPASDYPDVIAIHLNSEQVWVATKPTESHESGHRYTVDFKQVVGRLVAASPKSFEVATALAPRDLFENVSKKVGDFLPQPFADLAWREPDEDGSFVLDTGYQGANTALLVKHKATGVIGNWVVMERDAGEVVLAAKGGCTLHLDGTDEAREAEGVYALFPLGTTGAHAEDDGLLLSPSELPASLEIPQGRYGLFHVLSGIYERVAVIDARAHEARYVIPHAASLRSLAGNVVDSLNHPVPGAHVLAYDHNGRFLARTTTGGSGGFSFRVPALAGEGTSLKVWWHRDFSQPWLQHFPGVELLVNDSDEELTVEFPTSALIVRRNEGSPIGRLVDLTLTKERDASGRPPRTWPIRFLSGETERRLTLIPGEYTAAVPALGSQLPTRRFSMVAGALDYATFETRGVGLVTFHVMNRSGIRVQVELHASDPLQEALLEAEVQSELSEVALLPLGEHHLGVRVTPIEASSDYRQLESDLHLTVHEYWPSSIAIGISETWTLRVPSEVLPETEDF